MPRTPSPLALVHHTKTHTTKIHTLYLLRYKKLNKMQFKLKSY